MTEAMGSLHRKRGIVAAQHDGLLNFCILPVLTGGLHLFKLLFVGCQGSLHLCPHLLFDFDWGLHNALLCRQTGCQFYSHCSCCAHHSRRPGGTGKSKDHVCCSRSDVLTRRLMALKHSLQADCAGALSGSYTQAGGRHSAG